MRLIFSLALTFLAALPAFAAPRTKVAVLRLTPVGTDVTVAEVLTNTVTNTLGDSGAFEVLSQRDIANMLGMERQKELLGCTEGSCLAELGGALGAARLVTGSVDHLGATYVVNLQLIDTEAARVLQRASQLAKGEDQLIEAAQKAAKQLVGDSAPPPSPSAPPESERPRGTATLGLGLDVPRTADLRASLTLPHGFAVWGGVGFLQRLMIGGQAAMMGKVGVLTGNERDAVENMLHDSLILELGGAWDFGAPRGFGLSFGYSTAARADEPMATSFLDEFATPSERPASIGRTFTVTSRAHWLSLAATYDLPLSNAFSLEFAAGLQKTIWSNVSLTMSGRRIGDSDALGTYMAEVEYRLARALMRLGTPFAGVRLAYSL